MSLQKTLTAAATEPGLRAALLFALVTERLHRFYEHGLWLKEGQGATLAADWLARAGRNLPGRALRSLSAESDRLAREMAGALSREAGLYTAHELSESLDPRHRSDIGDALMAECRAVIGRLDLPAGADHPDRGSGEGEPREDGPGAVPIRSER